MARASAVIAVGLLLVLAGCNGTRHVEVTGSPAHVSDAALAETGYEHADVTNRTLNATVTATIRGDVEGRESVAVTADERARVTDLLEGIAH